MKKKLEKTNFTFKLSDFLGGYGVIFQLDQQ